MVTRCTAKAPLMVSAVRCLSFLCGAGRVAKQPIRNAGPESGCPGKLQALDRARARREPARAGTADRDPARGLRVRSRATRPAVAWQGSGPRVLSRPLARNPGRQADSTDPDLHPGLH